MQWEYYRLSVDGPNVETALHELGQNGWELVAVIPETRIFYGFQCFLKRPVAEAGTRGDAEAVASASDTNNATEPRRMDSYVSVRTNSLGRSHRDNATPESIASVTWQR